VRTLSTAWAFTKVVTGGSATSSTCEFKVTRSPSQGTCWTHRWNVWPGDDDGLDGWHAGKADPDFALGVAARHQGQGAGLSGSSTDCTNRPMRMAASTSRELPGLPFLRITVKAAKGLSSMPCSKGWQFKRRSTSNDHQPQLAHSMRRGSLCIAIWTWFLVRGTRTDGNLCRDVALECLQELRDSREPPLIARCSDHPLALACSGSWKLLRRSASEAVQDLRIAWAALSQDAAVPHVQRLVGHNYAVALGRAGRVDEGVQVMRATLALYGIPNVTALWEEVSRGESQSVDEEVVSSLAALALNLLTQGDEMVAALRLLVAMGNHTKFECPARFSLSRALSHGAFGSESLVKDLGDSARFAFQSLRTCPCYEFRALASLLPPVFANEAAVARARAQTVAMLRSLLETPGRCGMHVDQVGSLLFGASYTNHNDRWIKSAHGRIMRRRLEHSLQLEQSPTLLSNPHVCFITAFLGSHSVAKMSVPLMLGLSPRRFRISVMAPASAFSKHDEFLTALQFRRDIRKVVLPDTHTGDSAESLLGKDLSLIQQSQCDVAVFPELGMDPRVWMIALNRVAPLQVVSHGHSVTSGLEDTIDYFVSIDNAEPSNGWSRYTEQLVRLESAHSPFWLQGGIPHVDDERFPPKNNCASAVPLPEGLGASHHDASARTDRGMWCLSQVLPTSSGVPAIAMGRGMRAVQLLTDASVQHGWTKDDALERHDFAMQLSESVQHTTRPIVMIPQSSSKFHPAFDKVIVSLLLASPTTTVVLLAPDTLRQAEVLASRLSQVLQRAVPDESGAAAQVLMSRVLLLAQRGHTRFLEALAQADVVVDTWPFGGCTSTLEALAVGTPVVTFPHSDALSGRFSSAFLSAMNATLVASSLSDVVKRATVLGTMRARLSGRERRQLQVNLAHTARGLLAASSSSAVSQWEEFLERAVANGAKGTPGEDLPGLDEPVRVRVWSNEQGMSLVVSGPVMVARDWVCVLRLAHEPQCVPMTQLGQTGQGEWVLTGAHSGRGGHWEVVVVRDGESAVGFGSETTDGD
jgi:hypothetical protein